jgi:prepilin-type N-terminal cleavage/methylation domain-containing protein
MKSQQTKRQRGFSLLELLTASAIFLVLCGAAFGLLAVCQKSYQTESQVLNSFQEARLGLDQIVRDVNIAGYPPPGQFSNITGNANNFAITPVAWAPKYLSGIPCAIGAGGCSTPSDFDLIIETNVDSQQDASAGIEDVEWVRYQLQGTTLYRGVAEKDATKDPSLDVTVSTLVPFVQDVMNNASSDQITQLRKYYPDMFPTAGPVPIFKYLCDDSGALTQCQLSGSNSPMNIRDVEVTLIVQAPQPDATTGKPRLVVLNGRGHRINPNGNQ